MRRSILSYRKLFGKMPFQSQSRSPKARRAASRRFVIESLETRDLLAITATWTMHTALGIGSDDASDTIVVSANSAGKVTVNGVEVLGGSVNASAVAVLIVSGGGGNDTLNLSQVQPSKFTSLGYTLAVGGEGNDTIIGSVLKDIMRGDEGHDTYKFVGSGALGDDEIDDTGGSDTMDFSGLNLGSGSSGVTADLRTGGGASVSNGVSLTVSHSGINHVIGTSKNDTLTGNSGSNTLEGGAGHDLYKFIGSGALGTDTLVEGDGSDTIDFSGLTLGSGTSGVTADIRSGGGASVDNTVTLTVIYSGINHIIGTNKSDVLIGNSGSNKLTGLNGHDTIFGYGGDDWLEGGRGSDDMDGGAGDDTYYFDPTNGSLGNDSITEAPGVDFDILDFSPFTVPISIDITSTSPQTVVAGILTLTLSNSTAIEDVID